MPGMRWSVTITATRSRASTSSAAGPPPARSTRNSAARIASSESSTRASSSTIRTVATSSRRALLPEDLEQGLPLAEPLEPRCAELAIPYQSLDPAEGGLVGDDVRAEEAGHPLNARG